MDDQLGASYRSRLRATRDRSRPIPRSQLLLQSLPIPSRRTTRRLTSYLVVAVFAVLVYHFSATRGNRSLSKRSKSSLLNHKIDYAWGSILHPFQNHPSIPLQKPHLPPKPHNKKQHSSSNNSLKPIRTLIVTQEIAGLHKNGGIGSAYLELAKSIASNRGHEVAILLAETIDNFGSEAVTALRSALRKNKVTLYFVKKESVPFVPEGWTAKASKRVFDFLKSRDGQWDIIHFSENSGVGYFSLLAKHEGLALQSTQVVVGLHGAFGDWAEMLNKRYLTERYTVELAYFEKRTAELADVVVSPSEYMLEYARSKGWRLPPSTSFVIPNIASPLTLSSTSTPGKKEKVSPITELVFFGRLEERKGVRLFISVLEQLYVTNPPEPPLPISQITFLGRDVSDPRTLAGASSLLSQALAVIQNKTKVEFNVTFLRDFDRDQALEYLSDPQRLAIMPSLADNSPSTVVECINYGIKFIASDVGGVAELIHPKDREQVLFKPLSGPFLSKLIHLVQESILGTPFPKIRTAIASSSAPSTWLDLHVHLSKLPLPIPLALPQPPPLISICITHYERTELLTHLLDSIKLQTYQNFQVILVDDGSPSVATKRWLSLLERKHFHPTLNPGWTFSRINNSYLGEARNHAASLATGQFLYFLDDDDVLKPHALETLVRVALKTKAPALSSWLDEFGNQDNPLTTTSPLSHHRTYWFLGQSLSAGVLWNCFGSGNIFVTREAFDKVGGFSTYREVGGEDWEFYVKLALEGLEQLVVPFDLSFVRSDLSRFSMKYAMDPWNAGYHALVPILNDPRIQELGLAHSLMYARGHFNLPTPPVTFADSRSDFQLVQNWNGWSYSFEPAESPPTGDEQGVASTDGWSTDAKHQGTPYINSLVQTPHVSAKGLRLAAVRTFRAPSAFEASVQLAYTSSHKCGDGTRLVLYLRDPFQQQPAEELVVRRTMDVPNDDVRVDVKLEEGSTLHLVSDPLNTDECDEVAVRLVVNLVEGMQNAWSNLAKKDALEDRKTGYEKVEQVAQGERKPEFATVVPVENERDKIPSEEEVFHIALVFDEFRFPHAQQVIKSAIMFVTSRPVYFHLVAPGPLHYPITTFMTELEKAPQFSLYDHSLCYHYGRAVVAFSSPGIHISAHCKLFLSEIIDKVGRVLYLDTDVTILSDISQCYSAPKDPRTLLSLGVDMGDACQINPDACWPIGMHWRVPPGLKCGNIPGQQALTLGEPKVCSKEGELEAVQVNGGVMLLELARMRSVGFRDRYIQTIIHHHRITGKVAQWGEQDFINSYFRLYPNDLEFLPCGCNFQWFGNRQAVKCGGQPVYIAHHWSHGIVAHQPDRPYNNLFFHILENKTDSAPRPPLISQAFAGAPTLPSLGIIHTRNCPRQDYDCTPHFHHRSAYGDKVYIISRIVGEHLSPDLVDSIETQTYPVVEHLAAVRDDFELYSTTAVRTTWSLNTDSIVADNDELCDKCGTLARRPVSCEIPPEGGPERQAFFDCYCQTSDSTSRVRYELEALIEDPGWILYLDDDKIFSSPNAIAHLMSRADNENDLILFRSETPQGDESVEFQKKIIPRSNLDGLGFLFHSSHLDLTDWNDSRCGTWTVLDRLTQRLTMKWTDFIPTMTHPLHQRVHADPPMDISLTLVISESPDHPSWLPELLEKWDTQTFRTIVNETIVLTINSEQGMFGDDVKVIKPKPGSGVVDAVEFVTSAGVLLLSDSLYLDKPALNGMVNFWQEDPARIVGPFTLPWLNDFPLPFETDEATYDFDDEPDPAVGTTPFTQLIPRALIVPTPHFQTMKRLLAKPGASLHPSCQGVLLNAVSANATGVAGLRVLLPDASFTDRIHDCRERGYAGVVPGPQPGWPVKRKKGTNAADSDSDEPEFEDCVVIVEEIMGLPRTEWLFVGDEVGITGNQGSIVRSEFEPIAPERWKAARKREHCRPK
ncbi:hypothetical protein T439DRAFT_315519 [Meredithblackwellia eburnea MCA 4105]